MNVHQLLSLPPAKQAALITRLLPDSEAPLIDLESADVEIYVAAIALLTLGSPLSALPSKRQTGLLRAAEMQVGHVNGKVGNTRVRRPMYIDRRPGKQVYAGCVGPRTTHITRALTSAGNATDNPHMGFWCASCKLDGRAVTMAGDFAAAGPLYQACLAQGMSKSLATALHDTLAKRFGAADQEAVDRFLKQIYIALDIDRYVLVSPMQYDGLRAEVEARCRHRSAKGQKFNILKTAVGGANPINAGRVNAEIGGRHTHFLCLPPDAPTLSSSAEWLDSQLRHLAATGSVFKWRDLSAETIKSLSAALVDERNNRAGKDLLRDALVRAATDAIGPSLRLGDYLYSRDCILKEERYKKVPSYVKHWLDPRSAPDADTAAFAGHVFLRTVNCHPKLRGLPVGGDTREAFAVALQQVLEQL